MSRLANLYALAFALDAALSLLDGLLGELFGLGSLSAARAWLAELVLLASAPTGALLVLTPRLPWRILLPPLVFIAWAAFGAMPLPFAVESARACDLLLSQLQLGIAGATFASMRRATGGGSWLLTPESVCAPTFRFGHTLRAAALGVLVLTRSLREFNRGAAHRGRTVLSSRVAPSLPPARGIETPSVAHPTSGRC